jgi:hypothetical protein
MERQWLAGFRAANQLDQTLWTAAQSHAENQVARTESDLRDALEELQQFVPRSNDDIVIMPADMPLVGPYATRMETMETTRSFPAGLRRLSLSIARRHAMVESCGQTVQQCRMAVEQSLQGASRNAAPAGTALEAIRLHRSAYEAFLDSVVEYNRDIARYAAAFLPSVGSPQQFVAMLIPVAPTAATPHQAPVYSTNSPALPAPGQANGFAVQPSEPPSFSPIAAQGAAPPAGTLPAVPSNGNFPVRSSGGAFGQR